MLSQKEKEKRNFMQSIKHYGPTVMYFKTPSLQKVENSFGFEASPIKPSHVK